jgi:pimeloyl-ACP methyl ester carboxylesterase
VKVSSSSAGTRRTFRRALLWLIAILFLVVLCAILLQPKIRAHLQAAAVLTQLNGNPVPRRLRSIAAMPVETRSLQIPSPAGEVPARLYTPTTEPNAPGLVLVPGINYLGIDEPRLEAFARSMAACGLRVLTPELPGTRDYRIEPRDIQAVGDSAAWLRHASGRRVGLIGLSFSGSLALMAAARQPYSKDVSFVFAVGAYDDLYRLATFYATGADPLPDGNVERIAPNDYGPWVVEYEHLEDFVPAADVPPIRAALRARLYDDPGLEQHAIAKLTSRQKAEYKKLLNVTRNSWALAVSNKKNAAEMAAISPHGHLSRLNVPVYLLHGRKDDLIPFAESKWLARDLPPGTLQEALISPVIVHVTTGGGSAGWWDKWRLVHLLAKVLERAEAG